MQYAKVGSDNSQVWSNNSRRINTHEGDLNKFNIGNNLANPTSRLIAVEWKQLKSVPELQLSEK